MKKLLLTVVAVMFIAGPVLASCGDVCSGPWGSILNKCASNNVGSLERWDVQASLDAPYLVKFTPNFYLGAEVLKDAREVNFNEGWAGIVRFTYTGTLLNFSKK